MAIADGQGRILDTPLVAVSASTRVLVLVQVLSLVFSSSDAALTPDCADELLVEGVDVANGLFQNFSLDTKQKEIQGSQECVVLIISVVRVIKMYDCQQIVTSPWRHPVCWPQPARWLGVSGTPCFWRRSCTSSQSSARGASFSA